MNVLIVESPGKVKAINKYLGSDYKVLASFGHIRDLPSKDGSVKPDEDFSMVWDVDARAASKISDIAKAVKGADKLILATDPDREGEAISWHILEVLKDRKVLGSMPVERVVFNAVTKSAIQEAILHPRELNAELVDAYLARRALDYLFGFTLSPVLWRKLPGARSAGRVQIGRAAPGGGTRSRRSTPSSAQEYWSIDSRCSPPPTAIFSGPADPAGRQADRNPDPREDQCDVGQRSRLPSAAVDGDQRPEHFPSAASKAKPVRSAILLRAFHYVQSCSRKPARKLGFNAKRTMQVAQGLYEGVEIGGETTGLITYMRTDGITMAPEAITEARTVIGQKIWRALSARPRPASMPARPRMRRKRMKRCAPPASRAHPNRLPAISMVMRPSCTN